MGVSKIEGAILREFFTDVGGSRFKQAGDIGEKLILFKGVGILSGSFVALFEKGSY